MATIFRCDFCKKLFDNRDNVKEVTLPRLDYHKQRFTEESDGITKEACASCVRKLVTTIEEIESDARVPSANPF